MPIRQLETLKKQDPAARMESHLAHRYNAKIVHD